jgi:hypothetical protein
MATQPNQPQGIGGVLDTAFQLYKSSLGSVWVISLLTAIMSVVPTLFWLSKVDIAAIASDPLAMYTNGSFAWLMLLSVALSMWGIGALMLKQRAFGNDEQMSLGEAFQTSAGRLPSLLLTLFLYGVAIVVGFILLLVPGFILILSLAMCVTLVLFDRKGPIEALTGSHKLVWGNWWRACAVLTVAFILLFVIFIAVSLAVAVFTPFIGLVGDFVVEMTIQSILNAAINVVVTPFSTAVMIALYWDLKLRKEGGDLAARVNALSAA